MFSRNWSGRVMSRQPRSRRWVRISGSKLCSARGSRSSPRAPIRASRPRAVVERLLSISGGDDQSVNRKNRTRISTRLSVRFVLASNELPRLPEASGALATRFHILKLPNSFIGKEDHGLKAKLAGEMPAILQWSARGLGATKGNGIRSLRTTRPTISVRTWRTCPRRSRLLSASAVRPGPPSGSSPVALYSGAWASWIGCGEGQATI